MAVNSFNAQNPPVTTKGDVFTFSTIPTRLAVGANNTVLTADSTTATGLKWAATSAPSKDWAQIATTTLSSGTSYQFTSLGSYDQLLLTWKNVSMTGAGYVTITMNSNTTNGTYPAFGVVHNLTSATAGYTKEEDFSGDTALYTAYGNNASDLFSGSMSIQGCKSSGRKTGVLIGGVTNATNNFQYTTQFIFNSTTAITTLEVKGDSAFDAGTLTLWGSTV